MKPFDEQISECRGSITLVGLPRFRAPNTFAKGNLVCRAGGTWQLASNTDRDRVAIGMIWTATANDFELVSAGGTWVPWDNHQLGSSGDLWLGAAGDYLTAEPDDLSVVQVVQVVAQIFDLSMLLLHLHPAMRF